MKRHPFRLMRETLRIVQAQCALLLATKDVADWEQRDYAMLYIMNSMIKQFNNPTYVQYIGALGAYLRFEKRLIDKLVEGELKTTATVEWEKLGKDYPDLLEEKTA